MTHYRNRIAIALTLVFALSAAAQDPRQLFIAQTGAPGRGGGTSTPAHPAVRLGIELDANGRSEPVPQNHRFHTGDRFRFSFQLNGSTSYVYIVYRSIEGDPDSMGDMRGTKGLNLVNTAGTAPGNPRPGSGSPKFQLLWPPAGGSARTGGGQNQTIPGPGQAIEFDANPGMEKVSLLFSPYEIADLGAYFSGLGRRPRTSTTPGARLDTNEEVLAQLEDLGTIDSNTTTVEPQASRGICVGDCNQYSAPKNPERPFILTVDLLHAR